MLWTLWAHEALAGTPTDSYTIERYHTEAVSEQTTTSTTFQDAVTLTFTPPSTKDFLVLACALTNNSSTSYYTEVQLLVDSTAYSTSQHQPVGDTATNYRSFATMKIVSLTGGTPYTINIQYRTSDALGTAYVKNAAIAILEVTNYENVESNPETSTSSATYVDKTTLTFTPGSQADYFIMGTANIKNSASSKLSSLRFMHDANTHSETDKVGTDYISWTALEKENLAVTSHTLKIQHKAENPSSATTKDARIAAVLLSDIGSDQTVEDETESSTQSITYVDKLTLTFTPATRGDYLVIAHALGRQEHTSYAFYSNLDLDGSSKGEFVFRPSDRDTYQTFLLITKANLDATSHTIKIQYRTNNAAPNTEVFIKHVHIMALQIDTAESYNDSGHTAVDNNFSSGENTAYIWAHGLRASNTYAVGYYDGNPTGGGQLAVADAGILSTAYGNLASQYLLTTDSSDTPGTWHAVVFDSEFGSPPTNYNDAASAAGYVVEDDFYVQPEAIPEFPTVAAAIAVAGLCFVIYYLMRRRRLAQVSA